MRLIWIVLVLALLILARWVVRTSFIRVGPDEIGVRTVNFGAHRGIDNQDYGPGYHLNLWPLYAWNRFPSTVQRIRFAKESNSWLSRPVGELQLKLAGGEQVTLTIEVAYRIADGQAHRVLQDSGPERERYEAVVRNLAQDAARVSFGGLKAQAFYLEGGRERQLARTQAIAALRETMRLRGLELVDLLVESTEFNKDYEDQIKSTKLHDQRVELEKARTKAAEEAGKVSKIKAETEVKVHKIEKEADATATHLNVETDLQVATMAGGAKKYAAQKTADGSLYDSEKKAEGDKLIRLAKAEGTQRLNAALVGEGGRNLAALEAAKALRLAEVMFPSFGYEWFDPYEMAKRLGGIAGAGLTASAPAPK